MIAAPDGNPALAGEMRHECARNRSRAAVENIDAPPASLPRPALPEMPPIRAPAEPGHDAQRQCPPRTNQPRKFFTKLIQIRNTIESAEVGDRAVEHILK